jgi:hypothetical protein
MQAGGVEGEEDWWDGMSYVPLIMAKTRGIYPRLERCEQKLGAKMRVRVCVYPKLTRCERKLGAKMCVHIPQADKV